MGFYSRNYELHGQIIVARDYSNNHDHFEVPRRRRVSMNAAIDS